MHQAVAVTLYLKPTDLSLFPSLGAANLIWLLGALSAAYPHDVENLGLWLTEYASHYSGHSVSYPAA